MSELDKSLTVKYTSEWEKLPSCRHAHMLEEYYVLFSRLHFTKTGRSQTFGYETLTDLLEIYHMYSQEYFLGTVLITVFLIVTLS